MHAGIASISCFGLVVLLFVKGWDDRSHTFVSLWYGLWLAALVLAVVAVVVTSRKGISVYARVVGLMCAVTTLGLGALIGFVILLIAASDLN